MPSPAPHAYPSTLALVEYPHPVLRQRAAPVTVFDDALRDFCQRMFAAMAAENGIGLAAPQVAVPLRIFVTDHARKKGQEGPSDPRIWINPRIEQAEGEQVFEEGCLSFPGIYAKVCRPSRFAFAWQDERGGEHRRTFDIAAGDFLGIVVQHELDHLDGRLFVDHLSDLQIGQIRRRLRDLEAAYKAATGKAGAVLRR